MEADLERVIDLLRDRRVVVLAGAGCSTESGIPETLLRLSDCGRYSPFQFVQ